MSIHCISPFRRIGSRSRAALIIALVLSVAAAGCSDDASPEVHDATVQRDAAAGGDLASEGGAVSACALGSELPSTWVEVTPGTFQMGSPTSEACRDDDEAQHGVTLTQAYEISAHEVTQKQFASLMGYNPSFHQGCDDCPVEFVSWHEAAAYCNALSAVRKLSACYDCTGCEGAARCAKKTGSCDGFRLPSEAEWEHAARGGAQTAYTSGGVTSQKSFCMGQDGNLGRVGWYKVDSGGETHPVGGKQQNALGLFDMEGNVYEWTADWYAADAYGQAGADKDPTGPETGTERVFRGGSWYHNAHHARLANRERFAPDRRFVFLGFRCVRTAGGGQ